MTTNTHANCAFDAAQVELHGQHLIEASAGTGKTYSLASIYERLIDDESMDVERVLVVTFTRAATAELRGRLRERLRLRLRLRENEGHTQRAAHLRRQLRRFDLAAVFTIHGFCQRALVEHAFETGIPFSPSFVESDAALRNEIAGDLFASTFYQAQPFVAAVADRFSVDLARIGTFIRQAARTPDLPVVYEPMGPERETWPSPPPAPDTAPAYASYLDVVRKAEFSADDAEKIAQVLWQARESEWLNKTLAVTKQLDTTLRTLRLLETSPSPLDVMDLYAIRTEGILNATKLAHKTALAAMLQAPDVGPSMRKLDALLEAGKRVCRLCEQGLPALQQDLFERANVELGARTERLSKLTFRDLITRLEGSLAHDDSSVLRRSLSANFDAALIDEFQDTDPAQTAIFTALFAGTVGANKPVFYVGDPKQAIYGFRGADLEAYLRERRRPGVAQHTLGTNYRSSASLLRGVETLYANGPHAFGWDSDVGFQPVKARDDAKERLSDGAPLQLVWMRPEDGVTHANNPKLLKKDGSRLAKLVAADISELLQGPTRLDERPIRPGQVAVLVRTNKQGAEIQRELNALSVPSVLHGASRVLDSMEAYDLAIVLDAVAAPRNRRKLTQAFVTSMVGLVGSDVAELIAHEDRWERWARLFTQAHETWLARGFSASMRGLLDAVGASEHLLRLENGERRLTNLRHLLELLDGLSRADDLGPEALVRVFTELRSDDTPEGMGSAEFEQRLERDAEGVQIMTIHKSKGLEFDVVYCPFLAHMEVKGSGTQPFVFHDPLDDHRLKLHLGLRKRDRGDTPSPLRAIYREEEFRETARLIYVALTRARQLLVVHAGRVGGFEKTAFAHLLFGDEDDDSYERAAGRIKEMEPKEFVARLAELEQAGGGAIGVRSVVKNARRYEANDEAAQELSAREAQRTLPFGFRRTSYSGMIRGAVSAPANAQVEDRDVDETSAFQPREDDAPEHTESAALGAGGWSAASATDVAAATDAKLTSPIMLTRDSLAPGPDVGSCLHSILEHVDFQDLDALPELVRDQFARAAFPLADDAPVARALSAVVAASLDVNAPKRTLASIARIHRVDEMHFELPLAPRSAVSVPALADCFRRHGAPVMAADYADSLAKLRFPALRGYLAGDVDLLFRDAEDGRFYVVDYKSNHLGDTVGDYAPDALQRAMAHHHYFLQYHLYAVATHRYLAHVVPDYDYDRHFGGAYYLFLRGMAPASDSGEPDTGELGVGEPGWGVFHDRPSRALIEDLSRLLELGKKATDDLKSEGSFR